MNVSVRHDRRQKHLRNLKNSLFLRQRLYQSIRRFFEDRDFLEVSTPAHVRTPALEDHIEVQATTDGYLRPSPELHMKQLLTAGYDKIYQLGPCFRRDETGPLHSPEFMMLEWYRAESSYWDILTDTKELLRRTLDDTGNAARFQFDGKVIDINADWQVHSVDDAFEKHAGCTPETSLEQSRFEEDLLDRILPAVDQSAPLVLFDYPAGLGGLARAKSDNPARLERWELYIGGIEIANAYNELTDHTEQLRRYEAARRRRQEAGKAVFPKDENFFQASAIGIPDAGGIAFGVDRWLMMLAGFADIVNVQPFPEEI